MDLLEYQVKEWFAEVGIPVLPSQRIDQPTDLKGLKIPYPIVLKSQVQGGEREKAGGVRIVETTIDAIAAAQNIFNLPIWGQLPEVLLAESKYDAQEEFSLAVVLDTTVCRPVLLGCKSADFDWESPQEKIYYVIVQQDFSPFYARRLALQMGLQGELIQSVSNVVEKMYHLFIEKDLDFIEINPLGINSFNQVMALNGKVRVNDRAIKRHPEISEIAGKIVKNQVNKRKSILLEDQSDKLEMLGKIGILGNGRGSVLTTLDAVVDAGGKPGRCINLRHSFLNDTTLTNFSDRLESSLKSLAKNSNIQVILINFLGNIPQSYQLPTIISKFLQADNAKKNTNNTNNTNNKYNSGSHGTKNYSEGLPYLVIRLAGSELNHVRKSLLTLAKSEPFLIVVEDLDMAVSQAVRFTI
ncbi:succinate--CoA ligase subunit beta [Anabaena sp. FACHB-1237]|uniref:ATP-grasp domain-containing protein n=1 Tax=Anabaena sp. FACHB-1237 TaxID=2692769 RepID=UPI001680A37C|nr:ATP-grasp domain-containing protein [Anabaena sp. FACHB-1237]MBD2138060.1 succinate--CoA ligase subunit beta [Anabaena sp. FACHB-1237]